MTTKHTPVPVKTIFADVIEALLQRNQPALVYRQKLAAELRKLPPLIATAPELLEALELILMTRTQERNLHNLKPGDSPLHDRCRAVITKARGAS